MKIVIASDHGGFALKQALIEFLKTQNLQASDLGTNNDDSVDYPDFAILVAKKVSQGHADAGILICGTGIGMSIVANKFRGVRAAVVMDAYTAQMAKEHNNANVICLGGRIVDEKKAIELVRLWLKSSYEAGRHNQRLGKIAAVEKENFK